ncbi:MAG: repressor LexA [Oscillospiraceae bacterium]|nr:repressor LexA [Oscillospiraceae bacterium]
MRKRSEELMEKISSYIGDYFRMNHETPTTREIASRMGISNGSAYNYLVEMDKRGLIRYENGEISGVDKVEKTATDLFSAPLVGSIACGDPEKEEEQVDLYVSLPHQLFGPGKFYLLRAVGDSMEDEGIADGDLVLIRKQESCKEGDIVVAMDEFGENTLKKYEGVDKKSKKAILAYSNQAVYPDKKILVSRLEVQGVATNVFHYL